MLEEELTIDERLYLLRRRLGLSGPREHARVLGMSESAYLAWTRGEIEGPKLWLGGLDPGEYYAILRRRCGLSPVALGAMMGLDKRWIQLMEQGKKNRDRLREFWGH